MLVPSLFLNPKVMITFIICNHFNFYIWKLFLPLLSSSFHYLLSFFPLIHVKLTIFSAHMCEVSCLALYSTKDKREERIACTKSQTTTSSSLLGFSLDLIFLFFFFLTVTWNYCFLNSITLTSFFFLLPEFFCFCFCF